MFVKNCSGHLCCYHLPSTLLKQMIKHSISSDNNCVTVLFFMPSYMCSFLWSANVYVCLHVFSQVPAALLTFAWDAAVQADIAAAGGKSPTLLKPELLETIRTLN